MSGTIRWGILGTGSIAHKFADGLRAVPDAELAAVGSRAQGTADVFGDEFEVPRRHASYQSLAEDPEVDAIYVSTPHPMHCENTLLCLNADKAVLCEKTLRAQRTGSGETWSAVHGTEACFSWRRCGHGLYPLSRRSVSGSPKMRSARCA